LRYSKYKISLAEEGKKSSNGMLSIKKYKAHKKHRGGINFMARNKAFHYQ
jgi:hypothetical protein